MEPPLHDDSATYSAAAEDDVSSTDMALNLIAAAHRRGRLASSTLRRWKEAVEDKQDHKRHQLCHATLVYAQKLSFLFFRAWQWEFKQRTERRQQVDVAMRHNSHRILRRGFSRLRQARQCRMQREAEVAAMQSRNVKVVLKTAVEVWSAWLARRWKAIHLSHRNNSCVVRRYHQRWLSHFFAVKRRCFVASRLVCYSGAAVEMENGVVLGATWSCSRHLWFSRWQLAARLRRLNRTHRMQQDAKQLELQVAASYQSGALQRGYARLAINRHVRQLSRKVLHANLLGPFFQYWSQHASRKLHLQRMESVAKQWRLNALFQHWRDGASCSRHTRIALRHYRTKVLPFHQRCSLEAAFASWRQQQQHAKAKANCLKEAMGFHKQLIAESALDYLSGSYASAAPHPQQHRGPSALTTTTSSSPGRSGVSPDGTVATPRGTDVAAPSSAITEQLFERLRSLPSPIPLTHSSDLTSRSSSSPQPAPQAALRTASLSASPAPTVSHQFASSSQQRALSRASPSPPVASATHELQPLLAEFAELAGTQDRDRERVATLREEIETLRGSTSDGSSVEVFAQRQETLAQLQSDLEYFRARQQRRLLVRQRVETYAHQMASVVDTLESKMITSGGGLS